MDLHDDRVQALLSSIVGERITRIALAQWLIEISGDDSFFQVESRWELRTNDGTTIDEKRGLEDRVGFELWRIVGSTIVSSIVVKKRLSTLILKLSNGLELELCRDEDGYEDWNAHIGRPSTMIVVNGDDVSVFPPVTQ